MPACSGVAVITRPSGVSSQSPPRRLISALSAASRSVSWPRRWAMPVSRDTDPGVGQRGQRRHRRRQLADVAQVDVEAVVGRRPVHLEVRISLGDNGIQLAQDAQDVVGGLHAGRRPAGDAHRAAGDHGRRQERQRRWTDRVRPPSAGPRPRRAAPASGWATESSTSTPACRSIATVIAMCGADGTVEPVCCTVRPSVNDAPDSSRPDTNCDDADASIATVPPATDPLPCDPERQTGAVDPHAETAQRIQQRRDRPGPGLLVAVERDRRSASAASGGTNRSTVPARPQSTRAPGAGRDPAADRQLGAGPVDAQAQGRAARRSSGRCRGCAARR